MRPRGRGEGIGGDGSACAYASATVTTVRADASSARGSLPRLDVRARGTPFPGMAAREPVAVERVAVDARRGRKTDARKAERQRLVAEERGGGGGIERGGGRHWLHPRLVSTAGPRQPFGCVARERLGTAKAR